MIECTNIQCGWSGDHDELVCSDEDAKSGKSVSEMKFSHCPQCDGEDFDDLEEEEEDEENNEDDDE